MRSTAVNMGQLLEMPTAVLARLIADQREQDRLGWRKQVADFMTASGARCLLEHVSEEQWDRHYAANEDAYSAVVAELNNVEG